MSNNKTNKSIPCFLCGSSETVVVSYLRMTPGEHRRNLAYLLPDVVAGALSAISARFRRAYYPVAVNKRYFDRLSVFCDACKTGACHPKFSKEELADYYRTFYWRNRNVTEGQHVPLESGPNDRQLKWSSERIAWLEMVVKDYRSVIDFGAGDCAAGFAYKRLGKSVHVVDPSDQTMQLARKYGLGYSADIEDAPVVDLVYSAHSIEHVEDLVPAVKTLLSKVRPGGYVFFETPNVPNLEIFNALSHTPHTFLLSEHSFRQMEKDLSARILATECCGPMWRKARSSIRSDARTDLRVLLQKDFP